MEQGALYARSKCFVIFFFFQIKSTGDLKEAEYKLAQSGDATCNGLDSAEVGSRIMTLRKAPLAERCDFPTWFKGPKHWHALAGNFGYTFHSRYVNCIYCYVCVCVCFSYLLIRHCLLNFIIQFEWIHDTIRCTMSYYV